jgi:hypothetical protein
VNGYNKNDITLRRLPMILSYLFSIWLLSVIAILLVYRRDLLALWREPVLRHPVLIVESDDWGAGPQQQVDALNRLAGILGRYKDTKGRCPVMTIAVILAVPDGPAIRSTGKYHRKGLDAPCFRPVVEALQAGARQQVFALQLHGLEHYWPATLMASQAPDVRQWLLQEQPQVTESLPAHLQSRWLDATVLPSRPLSPPDIALAATEETTLFAKVLGQKAAVAVPPTFVWDDNVEAAWSKQGVEVVVTPGCRNRCRDERGAPGCTGGVIHNGDKGQGVTYVVRNDYFEPERGHTAQRALDALQSRTRQGRPCLLETHRSNYLGNDADRACDELERLMREALSAVPDLRFMSTLEFGRAIRDRHDPLLETHRFYRLAPWIARLEELPRFRKLGWLTGLLPILYLADFLLQGKNRKRFISYSI